MTRFKTCLLPHEPDEIAPDGSAVRRLARLPGRSMAHFELAPGQVSRAVSHLTVDEIWYFLAGTGQMWRRQGTHESVIDITPGVCVTLPAGTEFQFRNRGAESLTAVAVTMPPWPGDFEGVTGAGTWPATE